MFPSPGCQSALLLTGERVGGCRWGCTMITSKSHCCHTPEFGCQNFARQLHLIHILWRLSKGVCLSNLFPSLPDCLSGIDQSCHRLLSRSSQATRLPVAFILTNKKHLHSQIVSFFFPSSFSATNVDVIFILPGMTN